MNRAFLCLWFVAALGACDDPYRRDVDGGTGGGAPTADAGPDAGTDGCPDVSCPYATAGACDVQMPAACSLVQQPDGKFAECCAPTACVNGAPPCPIGSFAECAAGDTTVECCSGGAVVHACARPFGTLSHQCPVYGLTCDSGECAVDLEVQAIACCASHDPLDPCSI